MHGNQHQGQHNSNVHQGVMHGHPTECNDYYHGFDIYNNHNQTIGAQSYSDRHHGIEDTGVLCPQHSQHTSDHREGFTGTDVFSNHQSHPTTSPLQQDKNNNNHREGFTGKDVFSNHQSHPTTSPLQQDKNNMSSKEWTK